MLHPMDFVDEKATPYPTVTDFFTTFNEEMHSLYLPLVPANRRP